MGLTCVIWLIVLSLVTSCAGAEVLGNTEKIRYKMTVTVETPEGEKTGSAVREAGLYNEKSILPDQGGSIYNITKGEAVVIDLGQRGLVFALIGRDDEARNVFNVFPHREKTLPVSLSSEQYPKFVRFRDLNDPKTVESLLETSMCIEKDERGTCITDRFEGGIGKGVRLKSVTIEVTDEEVTRSGLEELLPYGKDKTFQDWYRKLPYGDSRAVTRDLFVRGFKK